MTGSAVRFRHDRPGTPVSAWRVHRAHAGPKRVELRDLSGLPLERVVVVAAHPDDETLGAGGLIATLLRERPRPELEVVLLTAGEASHPGSPTHDAVQLGQVRQRECREGLARLGGAVHLDCWDVGDGRLAEYERQCADRLTELVGDGAGVLVVGPWRRDGHPDHEAAGRVCAVSAARTGARLLEYPVWFWHWGDPALAPWSAVRALPLDEDARAAKRAAVDCHRSQVTGLSSQPGDEPLLGAEVLAHFREPWELFLEEPPEDGTLDRIHREQEEPWHADSRWYEERKRALLLALLPDRRHGRTLDLGCSTGVLTRELAARCSEVVAVDSSEAAVATARRRMADQATVRVERRELPHDWPPGRFDLVVISEVGYFLSRPDLAVLVSRVEDCLTEQGVVLLCHWRHPVRGWPLDGRDVHHAFEQHAGWSRLAGYRDGDVDLVLLGHPGRMPEPST